MVVVLRRAEGGEPGYLGKASEGAYIIAGDGSRMDVAGNGEFLGDEVILAVPASASDFKLFWPDNPPIDLGK